MDRFSSEIHYFPPRDVVIGAERQRSGGKDIDTSDLEPSIRERGIYHPLIIKRDMTLVTGERRLRTALKLGLKSIPCRYYEELDPIETKIVELEENERRAALDWRDHARAIDQLHRLYTASAAQRGEAWSQDKSAEMLFYSQGHISKCLRVSTDLSNPRIANAHGLNAAFNILSRLDERRIADAMTDIDSIDFMPVVKPEEIVITTKAENGDLISAPAVVQPIVIQPKPTVLPAEESIRIESFIDWARVYTGKKFNLIHCDFPFGTTLFNGPQSGRDKWSGGYDDDPDVYWQLIRSFCEHRDNFLGASAHVMFWLDMDWYRETLELFAELAPELEFHLKPLIWMKSNNMGILPDPKRGPRHIYETCLIASRGDRLILRATSDAYASPTDKELHPSVKPEPMLRYFMGMFVDEYTRLLDPTCGSAASLRAAEALGAEYVLGLEINKEYADNARGALKSARVKSALSKKLHDREMTNAQGQAQNKGTTGGPVQTGSQSD